MIHDLEPTYDRAAEVVANFAEWLENQGYRICSDDLDSYSENEYSPSWRSPEDWGSEYAQYLKRMDGGE